MDWKSFDMEGVVLSGMRIFQKVIRMFPRTYHNNLYIVFMTYNILVMKIPTFKDPTFILVSFIVNESRNEKYTKA